MKAKAAEVWNTLRPLLQAISTSTLTWALVGFFLAYLLFFFRPIFENSRHEFWFPRYVPVFTNVGSDLGQDLDMGKKWLSGVANPYAGTDYYYPPLSIPIFAVLSFFSFYWVYRAVSLFTMASYFFITVLFPLFFSGRRNVSSLMILAFIAGFMSYGFQTELERGNFNVIAVSCALFAVLIYRYAYRYKLAAFIFMTIAIQLKIYPAIFIFLFFEDGQALQRHWRDLATIAIFNIISLFLLGPSVFAGFLDIVSQRTAMPYIWIGNLSALSFATQINPNNPALIMTIVFLLFAACLFVSFLSIRFRNPNISRPYLFLACTIGALIIPSVSHDNKLPILVAPVILCLENISLSLQKPLLAWARIACFTTCSAAFAATLFSYTNKIFIPGIGDAPISLLVQNNLPSLMIILIGFGFLALTESYSRTPKPAPA
jgi:hypothetical protein